MHPVNNHKTLTVIDFEYANPNTRGLEFANHFTEWCYNYHDPAHSHVCNTSAYPTIEEQTRFLKAYVQHRPSFSRPNTPGPVTPGFGPADRSTSSISAFMLDARTPGGLSGPGPDLEKVAEKEEREIEAEVLQLLKETRLWRMANSAQWVAWGIVQAKVEGLPDETPVPEEADAESDPLQPEQEAMKEDLEGKRPDSMARPEEIEPAEDGEDEFDYLAYSHERALFFWGDALQLGMVKPEELPPALLQRVKKVEL